MSQSRGRVRCDVFDRAKIGAKRGEGRWVEVRGDAAHASMYGKRRERGSCPLALLLLLFLGEGCAVVVWCGEDRIARERTSASVLSIGKLVSTWTTRHGRIYPPAIGMDLTWCDLTCPNRARKRAYACASHCPLSRISMPSHDATMMVTTRQISTDADQDPAR